MATQFAFGKIVTDGLILSLDAADRNSYPGSGTTWSDLSGNGNNGTLTNGPTFSNNSIVFDGIDDFISGPTTGSIAIIGDITVSVWIKDNGNDINSRGILGKMKSGGGYSGYGVTKQYNYYKFWTAPTSVYYVQTNNTITDGMWHYIVGIRTGTTNIIYLDGILQSGTNTASSFSDSGQALTIGRYYSDNASSFYWNSLIGNGQIYNRALSASEIEQNYNAQKSRFNL
jgi:hypothetical protein